MSYEKTDDGAQAAAAKITTAEITVCNDSHSVRFFCQQCDSLFCGDCFTLSHCMENRTHEVDEIKESISRENSKVVRQMEDLNELAESAEAEANERDQKANKSSDTLIELVSEVERRLMISESNPEAQLRHLHRACLASLHYADLSTRYIDSDEDSVAALISRRSINAFLKQKIKDAHQVMGKVNENPPPDLVSAIIKSMVTIVGLKKVEGFLIYLKLFCLGTISILISLAKKYNSIFAEILPHLKNLPVLSTDKAISPSSNAQETTMENSQSSQEEPQSLSAASGYISFLFSNNIFVQFLIDTHLEIRLPKTIS